MYLCVRVRALLMCLSISETASTAVAPEYIHVYTYICTHVHVYLRTYATLCALCTCLLTSNIASPCHRSRPPPCPPNIAGFVSSLLTYTHTDTCMSAHEQHTSSVPQMEHIKSSPTDTARFLSLLTYTHTCHYIKSRNVQMKRCANCTYQVTSS